MSGYLLTPEARYDLRNIWSFIARDSEHYADRVEIEILDACAMLATNPRAGRVRAEMTNLPVRFWTLPRYRNYVVVYDPMRTPLPVLRILHGAMDLKRELRGLSR